MSILSSLSKMVLGLKGAKPQTFSVDPVPPGSLHLNYSTTGTPNVKWRKTNGQGMKPLPSKLDNLNSKYTPGKGSYLNTLPKK